MVRTQGSAYIYLLVPKERVNLGQKNVDSSYVQTCSKSPQNNVGRVITSPNAFLVISGSGVSGLVGVDFGPPPAKTGQTAKTVPARGPLIFVALG